MPFIAEGYRYFFHARTHTRVWTSWARMSPPPPPRRRTFSPELIPPESLRIMCSKSAQHILWIRFRSGRRRRCPQTDRAFYPEQHWMVAAERTGAEPGGFLTVHGLEWSPICIPINGWQPPNKPVLKTFSSTSDEGGVIEIFCCCFFV